jgi:hypothetical protein
MARTKHARARATPREYITVAVLSLLIVWLLYAVVGIFRKEEIARHTVEDTTTVLNSLQSRHDTLSANLHELSTSRGQEASLRQDFGVAKPGEEVVIIVPPKDLPPPPPPSKWQQIKTWFGF